MSQERPHPVDTAFPVHQVVIHIPRLMPGHTTSSVRLYWEGRVPRFEVINERVIPDNLEDLLPEVVEEVDKRPWFSRLMADVKDGKKSAIFKVTLGALVVFAAAGAGYEFGVQGGKHLGELHDLIKDHMSKKEEKTTQE